MWAAAVETEAQPSLRLWNMETTCTLSQQLVYDLGHFIGVTLEKEKLSASAEKRRSQLQQSLQPFIVPEVEVPEEEDYEDPSTIRVVSQLSVNSSSGQSDDGSKLNITLSELKKLSPKFGPLWKQEKGILRLVWRKHLAGIFEQKLVLFGSDKDVKPALCINIQGYVARPAPNTQRDGTKKNVTFEIICPGKRDYQFLARTVKDMEQWIAIICQTSIQHIDVGLRSRPPSDHRLVIDIEETYDDATSIVGMEMEEEYYDDIVEAKKSTSQTMVATTNINTRIEQEEEEVYEDPSPKLDIPPRMWNVETTFSVNQHSPIPPPKLLEGKKMYENSSLKLDVTPPISHVESMYDVRNSRSPILPPKPPSHVTEQEEEEEEEIYHDIVEYQQKLPPKPVIITKIDEPPPLPARRPLPSLPTNEPPEEEEETYEDINDSVKSDPKRAEQHVSISTPKIKGEEYIEEEETYDDVGSCHLSTEHSVPMPPVSQNTREVEEEVEEMYDDVCSSDCTPETKRDISANGDKNIENNNYKFKTIRNEFISSEVNKKDPVVISINVINRQNYENNQLKEKGPNSVENKGILQSFLQTKYVGENQKSMASSENQPSLLSEAPQLTTDDIEKRESNVLENNVSNQENNMKNSTDNLVQKKNTSFLYRMSSQSEVGNVKSMLKKFQSENTGSQKNQSILESSAAKDSGPGKPNLDFQNKLKKIGDGLDLNKALIPNKYPLNQPPESPVNTLKNIQNRPLPPKPSAVSENSDYKSSHPRTPSQISVEISVSRNKPANPPNKPVMNITVPSKSPSESSETSPTRLRNKPNGIPVPVPVVPDFDEPPKLPPRTYLK